MSFSYQIRRDDRRVVIELKETVDGAQLMQAVRAFVGDPAYERGYDRLWDGRGIAQLILSLKDAEEIRRLSEAMQEHVGNGRMAIVVSRDLDYSVGVLFEVTLEHIETRVFHRIDEAEAWLDGRLEPLERAADDAADA